MILVNLSLLLTDDAVLRTRRLASARKVFYNEREIKVGMDFKKILTESVCMMKLSI